MDADNIKTMITSAETALMAALANPAPTYSVSGPDGSRSVSFADYINMLREQLKGLQELLLIAEPYLISTRVIV